MATVVEPSGDGKFSTHPQRIRRRFYFWLSLVCAAVAVFGFMPTYWMQLPARTFVGPPLVHIHGLLSTAWVLFLISQTWLVSEGKIRRHRDWGLAGVALASAVVIFGSATAIVSLKERLARGEGDAARAFLSTPLTAITLFAVFTAAAIACTHRPEWHKRLMIAGTVSLVNAAAARFAFLIAVGHQPGMRPGVLPPPPDAMPTVVGLLLQLIVVAGMIHDKRVRGSVHPAWTVSLVGTVVVLLVKIPLSHTSGWLAFADWTTHIAG